MEYSDAEFEKIMTNYEFRHNVAFKSIPKNLKRVINYIETMPIHYGTVDIVWYLILEYGMPILYCFEPFYKSIIDNPTVHKDLKGLLPEIAGLVKLTIFPLKFHQLQFFAFAGIQNPDLEQDFEVKQKSTEEVQFIKDIETIRKCISLKKQKPELKTLPKDLALSLTKIPHRMNQQHVNPFISYYINKMLDNLKNQFDIQDINEMNKYLNLSIQKSVQISIQLDKDPNLDKKGWDGNIPIKCPPVFKGKNGHPVYILLDGAKCHIPNPDCYNRIFKNWNIIVPIEDEAVDKIPTGPSLDTNAALIQAQGQPPIYLLNHKIKRWIPNLQRFNYFGFNKGKVQRGPKFMIDNYETGPEV